MFQAQVEAWGSPPKYTSFSLPPSPGSDEVRIRVHASGIHRVVRSRASGDHYSSGSFPHVPGIDGVGTTPEGQMVYWTSFDIGSLTEDVNIPRARVRAVPQGADPVRVAGMTNPAMSSWMAFKTRTTNLPKDFTVLILGATSTSGRVAIPVARALGAKKIIGAARDEKALDALDLDQSVVVAEEAKSTDFSTLGDVDVVLDYIYGPLTEHLFESLRSRRPVQYVHIGTLSGQDISLPGSALRSKNLTIRGSGRGAWSMREVVETIDEMLEVITSLPEQPVEVVQLEDIEVAWNSVGNGRLVVKID